MLTASQRIAALETAIEQLHQADSIMQTALGAGDLCYDLHNQLENISDELQSEIDTMQAFQRQYNRHLDNKES